MGLGRWAASRNGGLRKYTAPGGRPSIGLAGSSPRSTAATCSPRSIGQDRSSCDGLLPMDEAKPKILTDLGMAAGK